MTEYFRIQPLESLISRGNRSFGAAGQHGECQMPPWPSIFAGAIRASMLGRNSDAMERFGPGCKPLDAPLGEVLGTPEVPGSFRLVWSGLAVKSPDDSWLPAVPLPADLSVDDSRNVRSVEPVQLPDGMSSSYQLPMLPVVRCSKPSKPKGGQWLTGANFKAYVSGDIPHDTVCTETLYKTETRVGIALNHGGRTAEEGKIYSTEVISLCSGAGFLVGIDGLGKDIQRILPDTGFLRFGGDGKAAEYVRLPSSPLPTAPLQTIEQNQRFRLVMTSPGIFAQGWLPDGIRAQESEFRLEIEGMSARLVCAAIGRHEVVSGWDLANWQPKAAQRTVPSGSVYWFDQLRGDTGKLANWIANGVWGDNPDTQRQAEGFNRAVLAAWPSRN